MAVNLEETLALTQNYASAASLPHVLDFLDPAAGGGDAVEDRVSGVDRRHRAGLYGAFVARLREARPELLATAMRERRGRKRPRCVAGEGHAFAREQRGVGFRFNFL